MKSLLFTAFILACEICNSQQLPDYCVYLVKGEVTVAKGNSKPVRCKTKSISVSTMKSSHSQKMPN